MKYFNWFNKLRVSVNDFLDSFKWTNENGANRLGSLMSKGLIRPNSLPVNGYTDVILPPASWVITQSISSNPIINLSVPTGQALLALDSKGNVISITSNSENSWTATPKQYQNSGHMNIPLLSGLTGYYYVWVCNRDTRDPNYSRTDKMGNQYFPASINGYSIVVTYNTVAPSAGSYLLNTPNPPGDYLLIGTVYYNASTEIMGTPDYSQCLYASIYQQNVGVNLNIGLSPATYNTTDGIVHTLADHINGFGGGTLSNTNVHALQAADVNALAAGPLCNTSTYGLFRNGLITNLGTDYLSANTGGDFQALMFNFNTTTHYIQISSSTSTGFIYNGILYDISKILGYSNSGYVQLPFTSSNQSRQGWYSIFITTNPDSTTNILHPFILTSSFSAPSFYQADNDTNIYLGYVYLYILGTTNYQLQSFENENLNSPSTIATGATGKAILPFYTWGTINNKQKSSNIIDDYSAHSNNLLLYNNASIDAGTTLNTNVNAGLTATVYPSNSGTIQSLTQNDSGSGLSLRYVSNTSINSAILNFSTISSDKVGFNNKPNLSTEHNTNIYTIYFTYSLSNNAFFKSITVNTGSGTYNLPLIQDYNFHRFMVTTSDYPTNIIFTIVENGLDSLLFVIGNFQVVEGHIMTDILVDDAVPTSKIVYNNSYSKRDNGNGTLISPETRITKMNFDNIMQLIPMAGQILTTFDTMSSMYVNYSHVLSNIEIFPVQAVMAKGTYSPSYSYYSATISFNSNLSPIAAFFTPAENNGRNWYGNETGPIWIDSSSATSTSMTIKMTQWSNSSSDFNSLNAFLVLGIIIMQKIS
jgi:hypothetical protein